MKKTLVVMAAGIGSRFGGGGLKQVEPVGPSGEFIIDYSVYDALIAGFDKVVFVIKKDLETTFKETIGKRLENKIEVVYAFQEIDKIPESKKYLASKRVKPWGTIQAVLMAKDYVEGDFLVINADDFYGRDAFIQASKFIDESTDATEAASINYPYEVTASKFGSVKRAVIFSENGIISKLVESKIENKDGYAIASPLSVAQSFEIAYTQPVAVNMFVFKHHFFEDLEAYFNDFFKGTDEEILAKEPLLADIIETELKSGKIKLRNIVSSSSWIGMTYREDLPEVKEKIGSLIAKGEYPSKLW